MVPNVPGAREPNEAIADRDVLVAAINLDGSFNQDQRDGDVIEVALGHQGAEVGARPAGMRCLELGLTCWEEAADCVLLPLAVDVGLPLGVAVKDAEVRACGCVTLNQSLGVSPSLLDVGEMLWGECHQPRPSCSAAASASSP
jgi:hypothetical protein